jgi:hypothetical protein
MIRSTFRYDIFVDFSPEYPTFKRLGPVRSGDRNMYECISGCCANDDDGLGYT